MAFGFARPQPTSSPRVSQTLGAYKALTTVADAGAQGLENGAAFIGLPVKQMDAAAGWPSAADAAAMHRAYIAQQTAEGVRPGVLAQFIGDVLTGGAVSAQSAPPAASPSGPGLIGGQAAQANPDGFVWSMLRHAAPGIGPNPMIALTQRFPSLR